jgi:hypothetical protein
MKTNGTAEPQGKQGDVGSRERCESSLLGLCSATFFVENSVRAQRKKKGAKKKEKKGLWKLTLQWKSAYPADSHSSLKTASHTTLGFFTVSTGPAAGLFPV